MFDKYLNENMKFYKVANYLNLQGIQKIRRITTLNAMEYPFYQKVQI
ncbi:hypothetical protein [Oceanotoga sp.]